MLDNIIVKKTLKSESRKINVTIQYKPVLGKYHNCNLSVLDKSVLSRVKNQCYKQIKHISVRKSVLQFIPTIPVLQ